jgi:hypothetical protein
MFGQLVYEDCSSLGRLDNDKSLLIPLNEESLPQNVFSGIFRHNQVFLDDVHETSFGEMSSVDDCVLQVIKNVKFKIIIDIQWKQLIMITGNVIILSM